MDTNVLFTFFWKDSAFNNILKAKSLILYSPSYALEELEKYAPEIRKKTGLTLVEFNLLKKELTNQIEFVPLEEYAHLLKNAKLIIGHLPNEEQIELVSDLDFLALSLKLGCSLWSNDKLLKKQPSIMILSTKEIIILIS